MIFSNSVKSHPLEIFIAILAGGSLMGSLGMIVAIPLYTSIKVMLKEFLSENKICIIKMKLIVHQFQKTSRK